MSALKKSKEAYVCMLQCLLQLKTIQVRDVCRGMPTSGCVIKGALVVVITFKAYIISRGVGIMPNNNHCLCMYICMYTHYTGVREAICVMWARLFVGAVLIFWGTN